MEPINYQFDIETSVIIDDVKQNWEKFQRKDLIKLSDRFEQLLIKKKIDFVTIDYTLNPREFNRYLEIIRTEIERLRDKNEIPIQRLFFTRNRNKITVFADEVQMTLKFGDPDFNIFFSFKLATIAPQYLELFLTHQLASSFNRDERKFKRYMQMISYDYSSILGGRHAAIIDVVDQFFPDSAQDLSANLQTNNNGFTVAPKNDDSLNDIFFPAAITAFKDCENQLLELRFLSTNYEWEKTLDECAAFIIVLFEKNLLKKPVKKGQINIRYSKSFKPFFEQRYGVKFTKQLEPAQRVSKRIEFYKSAFNFIDELP